MSLFSEPIRAHAIVGSVPEVVLWLGIIEWDAIVCRSDGTVSKTGLGNVTVDWRYNERLDQWDRLGAGEEDGEDGP